MKLGEGAAVVALLDRRAGEWVQVNDLAARLQLPAATVQRTLVALHTIAQVQLQCSGTEVVLARTPWKAPKVEHAPCE